MRIVLAHNFYGSEAPSGENLVFQAERDLLRARGHEVLEFTRHSDDLRRRGALGLLHGAVAAPFNVAALARLRRLLRRERPDVLHVHNTFPLLSPAIYHAARGLPVATLLTLHNFRTFCASALLLREGRPCTLCLDRRSAWPGLRHGCYRGSRAATLPLAATIALHRALGTWTRQVDAFIALTAFQRELLVGAGLPAEAVHVKPNFHPSPPVPSPWAGRPARALFVGRLAPEKGVGLLLDAWAGWGDAPELVVVGDGPERARLEARAAALGLAPRVRFTGQVPPAEVEAHLLASRLLIVPSIWFEGFPLVIREALAAGVPVAASRIGSLEDIVEPGATGLLFEPGDPADLTRQVSAAWADQAALGAMAARARAAFEANYTADACADALADIYRRARARREARGAPPWPPR
jgi:glycosyltransferase involved in cell wall biosynthesis